LEDAGSLEYAYPIKKCNSVGDPFDMEFAALQTRIELIRAKRQSLLKLLDQPGIGTLRIDVNQALEEIDDLLEEFDRAFPTQVTS
jgi:hypothetical protein